MNTFSRFDVLKSEVDLSAANRIKNNVKKDKGKKDNEKKYKENTKPQSKTQISNAVKPAAKKKKKDDDLQALAFGLGKKKGKKITGNVGTQKEKEKIVKKVKENTQDGSSEDHDDDWRKRDEEFIKSVNEESLREAILQSKLEFEEKKKEEKKAKPVEKKEDPPLPSKKGKKKKEKPVTLSLEQFNNLKTNELMNLKHSRNEEHVKEKKEKENDTVKLGEEKFFNDVEETTKKTIEMEIRQDQYKECKANWGSKIKHLNAEIEKRDFEIQALRLEVLSLRNQLQSVKSRNKKLCEVISFSEMRAKGELVMELEKVTKNRDEFSEEIAKLTAELEQERTKVSHLTMELKKIQGKKRNADSSTK